MVVGVVGLAMGLGIGLRFALAGEVWWRGAVGIAVLLAALVLTVIGLRSVVAGLPRWQRVAVRFVAVPGVLVVLSIVLPGVLATNVPPTTLGAKRLAEFGVVARDVEYLADDGTHLSAWYVASHNGAAVVLRHGAGSTHQCDRTGGGAGQTRLRRAAHRRPRPRSQRRKGDGLRVERRCGHHCQRVVPG